MSTQPISSEADKNSEKATSEVVLKAIRKLSEASLRKTIIWPLLREMGASSIRHIHGTAERGKDFVYLAPGFYGRDRLTVCQVKNDAFTGQASKSGNTTAILSQLIMCRTSVVLNPKSNLKETPEQVVLITTYPLPDKDVADGEALLSELKRSGCEVITPELLIELIKNFLPELFTELGHPGEGYANSLRKHISLHTDVIAFDLQRPRSRFFVNLGIAGAISDAIGALRIIKGIAGSTELPRHVYESLLGLQRIVWPELSGNPIIPTSFEPVDAGRVRIAMSDKGAKTKLQSIAMRCDRMGKNGLKKGEVNTIIAAVQLLFDTTLLFSLILRNFSVSNNEIDDIDSENVDDIQLRIPEITPDVLLGLKDNVCIVGGAGAGKTSISRAIAALAIERGIQCIYFPCQAIVASDDATLESSISAFLQLISSNASVDSAERYVEKCQLFIIDACDEAPSFGKYLGDAIARLAFRGRISQKLGGSPIEVSIPTDLKSKFSFDIKTKLLWQEKAANSCDFRRLIDANANSEIKADVMRLQAASAETNPRIMLTTRDPANLGLDDTFFTVRLLPFSRMQLDAFFNSWFSKDKKSGSAVIEFLSKNSRIREVCGVPIVASIVAGLQENRQALPQSKTEVYEKYFDLMLDKWDRLRQIGKRTRVSPKDKRVILRRLALELHKGRRRWFSLEDLKSLWEIRLAKRYPQVVAEDLLWELRVANSVVHRVSDGAFSLGHLSFQEFLAAEAILYGSQSAILIQNFDDDWWSQVVIFFAGICGDVEQLINHIKAKYGVVTTKKELYNEILAEARFTPSSIEEVVRDILEEESYEDSELASRTLEWERIEAEREADIKRANDH